MTIKFEILATYDAFRIGADGEEYASLADAEMAIRNHCESEGIKDYTIEYGWAPGFEMPPEDDDE